MQAQLGAYGQAVEGDRDIEQSIRTIVGTQKGSVPFNRDFGVDWLSVLDRSIGRAAPMVVAMSQIALEKYEPRITLKRVEPIIEGEGLRVRIVWVPKSGGDEQRSTLAP